MTLRSETDSSPELAVPARLERLRRRAAAMGLLESASPVDTTDPSTFERAVDQLLRALRAGGIAESFPDASTFGAGEAGQRRLLLYLDRAWDALEDSPAPVSEINELSQVLGWDLLASLVRASTQSLHRYAAGERATPDGVAARVHWLTGVVADLRAAYNEQGVRRWFERPRPSFAGRRPADLLRRDWTPDDPRIIGVREFAARFSQPTSAT
jgi:hypothetical protein